MKGQQPISRPKAVWAYAYQIIPPQPEVSMGPIRSLLHAAHQAAPEGAGTWEGRLVLEHRVTHILVVSDAAGQDLDVNRRIESELRKLDARFARTASLGVPQAAGTDDPTTDFPVVVAATALAADPDAT